MPKVFETDHERWEEYRKTISAIREELRDLLTAGSDRAITGKDPSSSDIIPHVTGIYQAYATGIRKVRSHRRIAEITELAHHPM